MNNNAVSLRTQGAEYASQFQAHESASSFPFSLTLSRVGADFLLLLCATMTGGAVGHVLQRTASFSLTPEQLLLGSLVYSALVLSLLAGENGTYTIYWASNLIDWLILTNVTITNGPVEFIDPINGEAQRFYRASPAP